MTISQAQILTAIMDLETVFRSPDGETAFASVTVGGHIETWPIRSKAYRRWLQRKFYESEHKPASAQAMTDALGAIEARAHFAGYTHPVYVRVAEHDGAIYLDLANAEWEAVQITPDGWRMISSPPVKFRRSKGMQPLPQPIAGGSLHDLRKYVNVRDDRDWCLLTMWLVMTLHPTGPYPVLVLGGEHGAAKSTTVEALRRLIDPNAAMLRAEPRELRDVMIAANASWLLALDNVSALPAWLSDALCRISVGGGFSTRELYTDSDETIFEATRPIALNGIEEVVTRPDLLDRALLLDLPPIADEHRRPRSDFWQAFERERPLLLGALLAATSMALRRHELIRLPRMPRMADFTRWATAAAPALGWSDDYFLAAYSRNRSQAHELALDAAPIAAPLRTLIDRDGDWSGTASELLEALNGVVDESAKRSKGWPSTAATIGGAMRRLAPNLRAIGLWADFPDVRGLGPRRRQIVVKKADVPERSERSERSSPDFGNGEPHAWNGSVAVRNGESSPRNAGNTGNADAPALSGLDDEAGWRG